MPKEKNDGYFICPSSSPPLEMRAESPYPYPFEPLKFFSVVFLLFLSAISNWAALAYIHDFVGREPLPDIVFAIIPEQPWALLVGDWMVTCCSLIVLILFALHKKRAVIIRRTLFILTVLYSIRTFSMLFTQLPSGYSNNSKQCLRQLNLSERTIGVYIHRILVQTIHIGFQDMEKRMLCGDLLYSGHTLIMVVSALTISRYLPMKWKWFRFISNTFMLFGMCCMIMSRTHYTIDVLFAYCFSVGVFSIYHAFCEIDNYRERRNSVLYNLWLIWIVAWLEEKVIPGKIENEFEVPFVFQKIQECIDPLYKSDQKTKSRSNSSSNAVIESI